MQMVRSPGRPRRSSLLDGVQPDWSTVTLINGSVQQSNLQGLIKSTSVSSEPRLSTVSANLQQAIGVASTTVAAGSATPAQAAATLENTAKSLSSNP
jgi:raffinose/stachyose/melibiose transport system substrate-binding protein